MSAAQTATDPTTWSSGMIVVHRSGTQQVLDRRKDPGDTPGWWLVDGGGIADWVAIRGDWLALTPDVIRRTKDEALADALNEWRDRNADRLTGADRDAISHLLHLIEGGAEQAAEVTR